MSADRPSNGRGDPALGVFETLRIQHGRALDAGAHLARLSGSLRTLYGLDAPAGLGRELASHAGELSGLHRLRLDALPRPGGVQVEFTASPLPAGAPDPVPAEVVLVPGGLGPHKLRDRATLDRLAPAGVTALIADRDGTVLEAAWGNLWIREGERLVTPPADGRLLPGVTRARLLAMRAEPEPRFTFHTVQEPISSERLAVADAVFITSALRLAVTARLDGATATDALAGAAAEPLWLDTVRTALATRA